MSCQGEHIESLVGVEPLKSTAHNSEQEKELGCITLALHFIGDIYKLCLDHQKHWGKLL